MKLAGGTATELDTKHYQGLAPPPLSIRSMDLTLGHTMVIFLCKMTVAGVFIYFIRNHITILYYQKQIEMKMD